VSDALLVQRADRIAILTLNRPDAGNALDLELLGALRAGLRRADGDDGVSVIVLTGADPAFCVGLALEDFESEEWREAMAAAVFSSSRPWEPTAKPVIGAVNGATERGGLELALHCDLLIASERATFADTHAALGLVPALGLTALLPRAVGTSWARRMSLSGQPILAAQALAIGLVTEVVAHGELLSAACRLASEIATRPPEAVRALTASYRAAAEREVDGTLRIELETHRQFLEDAPAGPVRDAVLDAVLARMRSAGPP
jgi:enoyl-CoA hydratase/carnithine racemase